MSEWESIGKSDDWFTPAYIFDALGTYFDLDVAAPKDGPRHVPCRAHLWENSLTLPWAGFIWMNPPFGPRNGIEIWLNKFIKHGNGIALTPDRTSAPWFQAAAPRMDSLLFVSPKVRFERPDGSVGKSPGSGTVLHAIGREGRFALERASPRLGFLVERAGVVA
jgi:hypothetical protein